MTALNCIAIDDEPLALDIIREYAAKIPFLNLTKTFDNAIEVIEYLRNNNVDIMFLDIQMEELTGIQLLKVLTNKPKVILTTAYDTFAIKGYELDVTDYLLKPFSFERFTKAVNKAFEQITLKKGNLLPGNDSQPVPEVQGEDYFFVKTEFRLQKVDFKDILYIEGQGDYQSIVTVKGKIMTLQNLAKLEGILPAGNFIRVHKSYIVSLARIEKIERNRIRIGEKSIPISDTYKEKFFDTLTKRRLI
ncbi:MAG: response regulator transcription factor [Bacteroidales bacterium]|nr:response regulator transcription factor [Bacteroidales bacterium]